MAGTVNTDDYRHWPTLREIDAVLGLSKGSSFRAFKRLEPRLQAGHDFLLLRQEEAPDAVNALRAQGRIYASGIHALLLSPALALRLRAALSKAQ